MDLPQSLKIAPLLQLSDSVRMMAGDAVSPALSID